MPARTDPRPPSRRPQDTPLQSPTPYLLVTFVFPLMLLLAYGIYGGPG